MTVVAEVSVFVSTKTGCFMLAYIGVAVVTVHACVNNITDIHLTHSLTVLLAHLKIKH